MIARALVRDWQSHEEETVPKVGAKRFPYTPRGESAAKDYAEKTGKPMTVKKPKKS